MGSHQHPDAWPSRAAFPRRRGAFWRWSKFNTVTHVWEADVRERKIVEYKAYTKGGTRFWFFQKIRNWPARGAGTLRCAGGLIFHTGAVFSSGVYYHSTSCSYRTVLKALKASLAYAIRRSCSPVSVVLTGSFAFFWLLFGCACPAGLDNSIVWLRRFNLIRRKVSEKNKKRRSFCPKSFGPNSRVIAATTTTTIE